MLVVILDPDGENFERADLPFTNRDSELLALRDALVAHRIAVAGMETGRRLPRVLVFYGEGGVGKSELSTQMRAWATGGDGVAPHWAGIPPGRVHASAHWDLNDSRGGVDPLQLLLSLRSALGLVAPRWPAFDLSFAALHRALKPGVEVSLRNPGSGLTTLSDIVAGLTADAVALGGVAVAGGLGAAAVGLGGGLLARSHARSVARRAARDFPGLAELVGDCERASGALDETAELAGRVAFMLSRQIDAMQPAERPLVLVFVDHMERLQITGGRHLGESTLNRLISRLPFFLFVVTGRKPLTWYETGLPLPASGVNWWPGLASAGNPPMQHPVGNLANADAVTLLERSLLSAGVALQPELLARLANETNGWPLHIKTIVDVAESTHRSGRLVTHSVLEGAFPHLVERLLSDLPEDVANAFRAACLLPFFDPTLCAAAGECKEGSVERMLERRLVEANPGSVYPYRVHDQLRSMVRRVGASVAGGWGEGDWAKHARLALTEARKRFERALKEGNDTAAVESLALAINVATENRLFDEWLVLAVRRAPSIAQMFPYIATSAQVDSASPLADLLDFLRLMNVREIRDVTEDLKVIVDHRTAVSSTAGLWRAYSLRQAGRVDEALTQLDELKIVFGDRVDLYQRQVSTTLRLARRFREAREAAGLLSESDQIRAALAIDRRHGKYDGALAQFEMVLNATDSRRFQIEQRGEQLLAQNLEVGVGRREVLNLLATATELQLSQPACCALGVLAMNSLFIPEEFENVIASLREVILRRNRPHPQLAIALALRSWVANEPFMAQEAAQIVAGSNRSASWVEAEIVLDHLGVAIATPPTQWLEPYSVVKERWLNLFSGVIDRNRRSPGPR